MSPSPEGAPNKPSRLRSAIGAAALSAHLLNPAAAQDAHAAAEQPTVESQKFKEASEARVLLGRLDEIAPDADDPRKKDEREHAIQAIVDGDLERFSKAWQQQREYFHQTGKYRHLDDEALSPETKKAVAKFLLEEIKNRGEHPSMPIRLLKGTLETWQAKNS